MRRDPWCSAFPSMKTLLGFSVTVLLAIGTCKAIADSLIVHVTGGLVQGSLQAGSVRFLGIPYGSAERFQYPSDSVRGWDIILNASHPGSQCPQHCPPVIRDLYCLPDNQMSESCLTLNIYRPAYNLPLGQAFPVIVFIHGGSFESGSGAAPLYNGDYLARVGGVILVTINYRLGAFGFLPVFNSYNDVRGNFGFLDQQVALRWVRKNIAKFDGDPNKVTLVGEEAGCQSVGLHLTSSASDRLFHSAILHSCPFTIPFRSKNESRQLAQDFARVLGCPDNNVDCLRGKSYQSILQAQRKISDEADSESPSLRKFQVWGPIVDKRNVHDSSLLEELGNARFVRTKPVMMGFVSEEGMTKVYRNFPLPVSANYFQRLIHSALPDKWRQVAETRETPYYSGDRTDSRSQMVRFINDFVYICPVQALAKQLTSKAKTDGKEQHVWMYTFDPKVTWSPGGSAWPPGGESYCQNEACQGLDLLYLFNPPAIPESRRGRMKSLGRAMAFYWTNFAKHHNPNDLQDSAVSSREGVAARGSLVASRGLGSLRQHSVGYPSVMSRNIHLSSSLLRLLQGGNRGPGRPLTAGISRAVQPQSGQGINRYRFSSLNSLLTQARRARPAAGRGHRFQQWPTYLTVDPLTSRTDDVTLVLTQPSPVTQTALFADVCKFWDFIGFS